MMEEMHVCREQYCDEIATTYANGLWWCHCHDPHRSKRMKWSNDREVRWQEAMQAVWRWYETHMKLLDEGNKESWVTWGKTLEAMREGSLEELEKAVGIEVE